MFGEEFGLDGKLGCIGRNPTPAESVRWYCKTAGLTGLKTLMSHDGLANCLIAVSWTDFQSRNPDPFNFQLYNINIPANSYQLNSL